MKNVVLIGSTSDIGKSIVIELSKQEEVNLVTVGRKDMTFFEKDSNIILKEHIYLNIQENQNLHEIRNKIFSNFDPNIVIIATGYLPPENREFDLYELIQTSEINYSKIMPIISLIFEKLLDSKNSKLLILSSVVVVRPRIRNFVYGSSKAGLDYFLIGLARKYKKYNSNLKIIRPGFVYSKMTENFRPAPFATSREKVAKVIIKNLNSKKIIIYTPPYLKYVMNILRFVPRFIFDKL